MNKRNLMIEAHKIARGIVSIVGDYMIAMKIALKKAWEAAMVKSVDLKFGSRNMELSIVGSNEWEGGENKRVYFDIESSSHVNPVIKFYEIISGDSRDEKIEVNNRLFGYDADGGSRAKERNVREALEELAGMIA